MTGADLESRDEAELAVVIGRPGRDIAEADALDHIFRSCCANDVSARVGRIASPITAG